MNPATEIITLENGTTLPIGMNFFALSLMSKYPGGLMKLQKQIESMDMESEEVNDEKIQITIEALGYLAWCMINAGGTQCTKEEAQQMMGIDDLPKFMEVFMRFSKSASQIMPKNSKGRARK